jgi:hypothetical protein
MNIKEEIKNHYKSRQQSKIALQINCKTWE